MRSTNFQKYIVLLFCFFLSFGVKASGIKVYIIISEECPICQFMGPELGNINEYFGDQADLYLVFPFRNTNIKEASLYKREFGLSAFEVLMDADQSISKGLGATITPEAIVVNEKDEIIYRGRINDTYLSPGRRKHSAGRRDLQIAISNAINDKPIEPTWPNAVGCYITFYNTKE